MKTSTLFRGKASSVLTRRARSVFRGMALGSCSQCRLVPCFWLKTSKSPSSVPDEGLLCTMHSEMFVNPAWFGYVPDQCF